MLTIKIAQDRSISWLIGGCVLAVFGTFYITQFLDLAGWSANYNVAQWEKDRTRNLDTYYLCKPWTRWSGLPCAGRTDQGDPTNLAIATAVQSEQHARSCTARDQLKFDWQHWREFSLRAYWNRWALDDKK